MEGMQYALAWKHKDGHWVIESPIIYFKNGKITYKPLENLEKEVNNIMQLGYVKAIVILSKKRWNKIQKVKDKPINDLLEEEMKNEKEVTEKIVNFLGS